MKKVGIKSYEIDAVLSKSENEKLTYLLKNEKIESLKTIYFEDKFLDKENQQLLKNYSKLKSFSRSIQFKNEKNYTRFDTIIKNNKLERLTYTMENTNKDRMTSEVINECISLKYLYLTFYSLNGYWESITQMINNLLNLETLQINNPIQDKMNDLPSFTKIKDNYSIKTLILSELFLQDHHFLQRFKGLKELKLNYDVDLEELIKNISCKEMPYLKHIDIIPYSDNLTSQIDYSMTSLVSFKFLLSSEKGLSFILKGLEKLEKLKVFIIKTPYKVIDNLYPISRTIKEVLINCENLEYLKVNVLLTEYGVELLLAGLNHNSSLKKFHLKTKKFYKNEKELGKILKSKSKLSNLSIGYHRGTEFNINDFLSEFHTYKNLEYLILPYYEDTTWYYLPKLIHNCKFLNKLRVGEIYDEKDLIMICEAIQDHKHLKSLDIFISKEFEFESGKPLIEMIKENKSLESIYVHNLFFNRNETRELFHILSRNSSLKKLKILSLEEEISELIRDRLIYNFNINLTINRKYSLYNDRNIDFINQPYSISSWKDVAFKFRN